MERFVRAPSLIIARDITHIKESDIPISHAVGITFAGGKGSRMELATGGKISKTVLQVSSSSVAMDSSIALMRAAGVRSIHVLTSESAIDSQKKHFHNNTLYDGTHFTVEPAPQQGIGPALNEFLKSHPKDRPIITTNADEIYTSVDLKKIYNEHTWQNHQVTGVLVPYPEGSQTDKYWIDKTTNQITRKERVLSSADIGGYEGTGIWIIEPSQFPILQQSNSWHDFLRTAIGNGDVHGYVSNTSVWNLNTPSDLVNFRQTTHV